MKIYVGVWLRLTHHVCHCYRDCIFGMLVLSSWIFVLLRACIMCTDYWSSVRMNIVCRWPPPQTWVYWDDGASTMLHPLSSRLCSSLLPALSCLFHYVMIELDVFLALTFHFLCHDWSECVPSSLLPLPFFLRRDWIGCLPSSSSLLPFRMSWLNWTCP